MSNHQSQSSSGNTRRSLLTWFSGAALAGSAAISAVANFVFMKPRATYGQPSRYSIGRPDDYPSGTRVSLDARRVCVVREGPKLAVISTICTHLGCTVGISDTGFACPCHGSRYDQDGNVVGGPAPKSLAWYQVAMAPNGELEVDTNIPVDQGTYYNL